MQAAIAGAAAGAAQQVVARVLGSGHRCPDCHCPPTSCSLTCAGTATSGAEVIGGEAAPALSLAVAFAAGGLFIAVLVLCQPRKVDPEHATELQAARARARAICG